MTQFHPSTFSKKEINSNDNGKHNSTRNEASKVYVFSSEISTSNTSTIKIPSVSELYSHVS